MARTNSTYRRALSGIVLVVVSATHLSAQGLGQGDMVLKNEGHAGAVLPDSGSDVSAELSGSLRFEPITMLGDLYRKDIVLLMRHGPTDWSQMDARGVDPKDCKRQRMLTADGKQAMRQLGMHLAVSEILPTEIRVSPWCRNGETFASLMDGILRVNPDYSQAVKVTEDFGLGLLLSLSGAPSVTPIREAIDEWKKNGPTGPL